MSPRPVPKRLYKYASPAGALAILRTRSLWCRSPVTFDDPYDSQIAPRMGCSVLEIATELQDEMERLVRCDEPLHPQLAAPIDAAIKEYRPYVKGMDSEEFATAFCGAAEQWEP